MLEQRRRKSREAHDRLAERWVEVGQDFASGSLRAEVLAQAWPRGLVVADLGLRRPASSRRSSRAAGRSVLAVDHSERMLAAAERAKFEGTVEFRRGELDALPLADDEVDAAFANLVWHHLPDFAAAAREVFRVSSPAAPSSCRTSSPTRPNGCATRWATCGSAEARPGRRRARPRGLHRPHHRARRRPLPGDLARGRSPRASDVPRVRTQARPPPMSPSIPVPHPCPPSRENDMTAPNATKSPKTPKKGARPVLAPTDFKVKDLVARRIRPQGDPAGRGRDARPDGDPRRVPQGSSPSPAPASSARST